MFFKIHFLVFIFVFFTNFALSQISEINIEDKNFLKFSELAKLNNDKIFLYKTQFIINELNINDNIYLVVPPTEYVCNIYLNDNLVFQRGNSEENYTNRVHYSSQILLSRGFLKTSKDSVNEIIIEYFAYESEKMSLPQFFIANRITASEYVFWRNFFNLYMFQALSFSSLVIAIYFFILYFWRSTNKLKYYIWFAISNIFAALAFTNNFFSFDFVNNLFFEKISRISLGYWGCFNILFLLEFTNIFKRKKLVSLFFIIIYSIVSIPMFFLSTTTKLIEYYNVYPVLINSIGTIFYYTTSIKYLKQKRNFIASILFLTYTITLLSVIHDYYYFMILKEKAFIITLPYMIFLFELVIFLILGYEKSQIYLVAVEKTNELTRLTTNIEKLVKERTKQLNQTVEQLNNEIEIRKKSEIKLAESNAMKDKFFSIVAHDLRNPFGAVKNLSSMLKKNYKKYSLEEMDQIVNHLDNSTNSTQHFLDSLLEWSRSQMDRIVIKNEKINLFAFVNFSIDLIKNQAVIKKIETVNNVQPDIYIYSDKNLLSTVLRNLITNAIKFSYPNSEVIIDARENDEICEISVTDFGIGIAKENIDKLFTLENKFSTKGTAKERGSGLGLIICKDFIEKIGGKLFIESEYGKGSKFYFWIQKKSKT